MVVACVGVSVCVRLARGGGMYHGAKSGAQHTAKWQPPPSRQQLQELAAQTEGWAGGCNTVLGTIKLGSPAWGV